MSLSAYIVAALAKKMKSKNKEPTNLSKLFCFA